MEHFEKAFLNAVFIGSSGFGVDVWASDSGLASLIDLVQICGYIDFGCLQVGCMRLLCWPMFRHC